jgi:S-methylmethionine-dependent homocysteine/selenocysteine methylase
MTERAAPSAAWIRAPFTVVDGGLSTALDALGAPPTGPLWTARALLERPEVIVAAHRRFVDAGAEVIITASYQASEAGFVRAGATATEARSALASTTSLARAAGAPFVAASVGPFGAALADGSEYHGRYDAGWDEVRSFHRRRLDVLVDSGPDLYAVETIPTAVEAEIIVDELLRHGAAPGWVTMSRGDELEAAATVVDASGWAAAFGVNCVDPRDAAELLVRAGAATALPLVVYPNRGGTWDAVAKCWVGDDSDPSTTLASRVAAWVAAGARLVGGCCGTDADVVAALRALTTAG